MRVLVERRGFLEAPDDLPLLVRWDPSNPYAARLGVNRGCPPGYVTQFRSSGAICRLATEEYVQDPTAATRETAITAREWAVVIGGAVRDTIPQFFTVGIPAVAEWTATLTGRTAAALVSPVTGALWPVLGIAAVLGVALLLMQWPGARRR